MHQLRVLPFREIVKRAVAIGNQISLERISKVRAHVFDTTISDLAFFERAFGPACPERDGLLNNLRTRTKPFCFVGPNYTKNTGPALLDLYPSEKDKVISRADKICNHTFDLLGSGDADLGIKIDWHRDFKTGYRWDPDTYYKDIKIPYGKADIKVPWELSRFQHAVTLGQAYWLTNDDKYAQEFASQVTDWIDSNKPLFGVNWQCTMDVAIRTCNWIAGYSFLKDSPRITDAFLLKFLKSLYQHGKHIRKNLEYSEVLTSNHYLSNITGLVYLGVLFPEFKESGEWKQFGIQELIREMQKQVYPDGCDFEASTCYHRLVLEFFFYSTLLVVINDPVFDGRNHRSVSEKVFGPEYTDKLYRMFDAVLYLLKPNGMMPQIGDNDSGRLHAFAERDVLDMRYLLALGAVFFQEAAFKVREFGLCEETLWIFGKDGLEIWQGLPENSLASLRSRSFPDAGWYVMRHEKNYMIISCGPNGQNGNGGHAHNDKLSFELMIKGEDAIVDPGTYLYTPDPLSRNIFRSTTFHNTVTIDGMDQNGFSPSDRLLFTMQNDSHPKAIRWDMGTDMDIFIGEHYGYRKLASPVIHQREIRFHKIKGTCEIIDRFAGQGEHLFEWNLIVSPNSTRHTDVHSPGIEWRKGSSFYSQAYGSKVNAVKYMARVKTVIPYETSFSLEPADN
jgi:hypothetical protein